MGVQGKEYNLFVMGHDGQDQINNAEDLPLSRSGMADLTCVMIVHPSNLDITNGLKKVVDDTDLRGSFGSLVKLNSNGSCITRLV